MTPETVDQVDCVVIGAGVVGCAVAHALTQAGIVPVVLERGPRVAEGVTSRNSGVVHAGLYYPPGSIKAQACVRGNALLYEWCERSGVEHRKLGKWVVGGRDEEAALHELYENARAAGARGLQLKRPQLAGVRAELGFFSPETGIVDPAALTYSLQAAAEEKGAMFLTHAAVTAIERLPSGNFRIQSERGMLETGLVINSAGLYADEVAALAGVRKYRIHPCRGDYFRWSAPHRYKELIYPVKKKKAPGLGVHLTLGLDGSCRLGPDTTYVSSKEAFGDPAPEAELNRKRQAFYEAAAKYLEGVKLEDLSYDSCGIRPKLRGPNDADEVDFVIAQDLPGLINLVGIESPGLTASLDLAERVVRLLGQ